MRKPYSPAYIAETVALAVIIGADATARQRNIDPRTVRGWCERAGKGPADAISSPDWAQLGDLARSGVAADLATGKLTAVQKATIAGIAERNAREVPPEPEPDQTPAERDYTRRLEAALAAKYGVDVAGERASELIDDLILDLIRWSGAEERDGRLGMEHAEEPEALVARLPADWDTYRQERQGEQRAYAETWDTRRARSGEAWPAFHAGWITDAQRDAWIRGEIASPVAATVDALVAEAEAYLRESAA